MLGEIALKLSELYHKANINTIIGSNVERIATDIFIATLLVGCPNNVYPIVVAANTVEKRKEKYGRRILDIYRKQEREQEGIKYLRGHFTSYLDNIVSGEPIPNLG